MNTRETALHCALLWLGLAGSVLAWDADGRTRRSGAARTGTAMSGAVATRLGIANIPAPTGRDAARLCMPGPPRAVRCGDALVRPRSQR